MTEPKKPGPNEPGYEPTFSDTRLANWTERHFELMVSGLIIGIIVLASALATCGNMWLGK